MKAVRLGSGISRRLSTGRLLVGVSLLAIEVLSATQTSAQTVPAAPDAAAVAPVKDAQPSVAAPSDQTAVTPTTQESDPATATAAAQDIVVTGTRLTSGFVTPSPVTSISSAALEARAGANISQTLTELPQFKATNTGVTARGSLGTSATNQLALFGLGPSRTLTLIDGRRSIPSPIGNTIDSNQIPSTLVDRVDVVTGGASAQYGSDAIAGVVNIILKKKYEGLELVAQQGISQYGDNSDTLIGGTFGKRFGKLHVMVSGEYEDLGGVGTALTRPWGRRQTGLISLPTSRPAGTPAQVFADNATQNNVAPGSIILAGPAALVGQQFLPGGQLTPFDFGTLRGGNQSAGTTSNVGVCANCYGQLNVPFERTTARARVSYDLGADTEVWAEYSYYLLIPQTVSGLTYYNSSLRINANSPFLPAGVASQLAAAGSGSITVGTTNDAVGTGMQTGYHNQHLGAVGLKGKVFGDWKWDVFAQYGRYQLHNEQANVVKLGNYISATHAVRDAAGNVVCGPLATNPNAGSLNALQISRINTGCVPYNPIGGTPSQAAINYVTGTETNEITNKQLYVGGNLSGTLFDLPAGPLAVATGFEFQRYRARFGQDPDSGVFSIGNQTGFANDRDIYEGYVEADVPLMKDLPLINALNVNGAVRLADYNDIGTRTTWKVGGTWDLTDWVRLRVTRSHDIRAPAFSDRGLSSVIPALVRNPVTGASAVVTINNANGDFLGLGPETSEFLSYGVVLTPKGFLSGFRASADYFDMKIDNQISRPGTQFVIDECLLRNNAAYCPFVTQDNSTVGFSQVINPTINFGRLVNRGYNFEAQYAKNLQDFDLPGRVTLSGVVTHVYRFDTIAAGSVTHNAGVQLPKWRWNATLNYTVGAVASYVQVLGFGKTFYSPFLLDPTDDGYISSSATSISNNRFAGQSFINMGTTISVDERMQFFGTIDNLFNKQPPANSLFNNAAVYDSIGRRFKAGVRIRM